MINFKPESTCHFGKDSKTSKDENRVDNFAAKLTNRDLCLHDLNITLRIALFNKLPLRNFMQLHFTHKQTHITYVI